MKKRKVKKERLINILFGSGDPESFTLFCCNRPMLLGVSHDILTLEILHKFKKAVLHIFLICALKNISFNQPAAA